MLNNPELILSDILSLNKDLVDNENYSDIIERILQVAQETCSADGYFFYKVNDKRFLNFEFANIKNKQFMDHNLFPSIFLPSVKNKKMKTAVEICALNQEIINNPNIHNVHDIDFSSFFEFDDKNDYTTISMLTIPLTNHKKNLIAVIQFINPKNSKGQTISFTSEMQNIIYSICPLITLVISNKTLKENYSHLLESFIEVLARAIDAKSPYTGGHCQRVPIITKLLTTAAIQENSGSLKNFEMSDDDWYALHIASWLHDCGKITTPEHIVDKATKLETVNNRIHEIRTRFEVLRRDAHIEYLKKRLQNTNSQEELQIEYIEQVKNLEDDFNFIADCNIGDKKLTPEDSARIVEISKRTFTRNFNRMTGLSWAEKDCVKDIQKNTFPEVEHIIQDREDQLLGSYNNGELYNLRIVTGTINKEERRKVNEHITVTTDMLKALPFPPELSSIIEYAGSHHERIDGKGYPKGLTGDEMSIPAKIMAIADIFEALTACDRPYKVPKKLSEVLRIMYKMKMSGHIDPELYDVFIKSNVFSDYAKQYIDDSQIDEIIIGDYL